MVQFRLKYIYLFDAVLLWISKELSTKLLSAEESGRDLIYDRIPPRTCNLIINILPAVTPFGMSNASTYCAVSSSTPARKLLASGQREFFFPDVGTRFDEEMMNKFCVGANTQSLNQLYSAILFVANGKIKGEYFASGILFRNMLEKILVLPI